MEKFLISKNPKSQSFWVPFRAGYITASGAPSIKKLDLWRAERVTDVVTLLRSDEMQGLSAASEGLGLNWHHFPLSGRRLESADDARVVSKIPELADLLHASRERRIVVHCAAGMHRTGLFLYILLRSSGLDPGLALQRIEQARKLTAEELCKSTKHGILLDQAEALFQSGGKSSAMP